MFSGKMLMSLIVCYVFFALLCTGVLGSSDELSEKDRQALDHFEMEQDALGNHVDKQNHINDDRSSGKAKAQKALKRNNDLETYRQMTLNYINRSILSDEVKEALVRYVDNTFSLGIRVDVREHLERFKVLCKLVENHDECSEDLSSWSGKDWSELHGKQYDAIRKSYITIALTFVETSKKMLKEAGDDKELEKVVSHIAGFDSQARKMLMVLISIGIKDVHDMWLLYICISEIGDYLKRYNIDQHDGSTAESLIAVLAKVADSLRANIITQSIGYPLVVSDMNGENPLVLAWDLIEKYDNLNSEDKQYFLGKRFDEESLKMDRLLYLNDVASDAAALGNFLKSVDRNVKWYVALEKLCKDYASVKGNPDNVWNGFGVVKKFQKRFVDLMTIAMLRIAWTQVTLEEMKPSNINRKSILNVLRKFLRVTNMGKTDLSYDLLNKFYEVPQESLITLIENKITRLSQNFRNFNALEKPVNAMIIIDMKKNLRKLKKITTDIDQSKTKYPPSKIEHVDMNIDRARIFVQHLEKLLEHVDLAMAKLLFKSANTGRSKIIKG